MNGLWVFGARKCETLFGWLTSKGLISAGQGSHACQLCPCRAPKNSKAKPRVLKLCCRGAPSLCFLTHNTHTPSHSHPHEVLGPSGFVGRRHFEHHPATGRRSFGDLCELWAADAADGDGIESEDGQRSGQGGHMNFNTEPPNLGVQTTIKRMGFHIVATVVSLRIVIIQIGST